MKIILSFLAITFLSSLLSAQCCPYMIGVDVFPANPQQEDEIVLITHVATPNNGHLITSSVSVVNDTIFIDACYYSGMLTIVTPIDDTLQVGQLPAGMYHVVFTADQSSYSEVCISENQQQFATTFGIGLAQSDESFRDAIILYPNPASDELFVKTAFEALCVYDVNGCAVEVTVTPGADGMKLNTVNLNPGSYLIVAESEGKVIRSLFVKE